MNLKLQGRKSDLVSCSQMIKGFISKLNYWRKQLDKHVLNCLKILLISTLLLSVSWNVLNIWEVCRKILREDMRNSFTTYPLWFEDLANLEPEDNMEPEVVQKLLDLK